MPTIEVQLDDETAEAVGRLAAEASRTEGDVVRVAEGTLVGGVRQMPKGVDNYRSGADDASARAREVLREAVADEQCP